MIYGVGTDIIEIERIEKAISKEGFKNKVFTENEIKNIEKRGNRAESYAGVFSAKEAISKALGYGVRGYSLKDIEILNDDLGKPYVSISRNLEEFIVNKYENFVIDISISHSRLYATAVAVLSRKGE